jgi:hypothetical protein
MSFAVPSAALAVRMPLRSGLIADRQYIPSSTAASGKNFTAASAAACGGPGVTIGLLRNLCVAIKDPMRAPMMIFRTVTEFSIFDFRFYSRRKKEEAVIAMVSAIKNVLTVLAVALFKIRVRCAARRTLHLDR